MSLRRSLHDHKALDSTLSAFCRTLKLSLVISGIFMLVAFLLLTVLFARIAAAQATADKQSLTTPTLSPTPPVIFTASPMGSVDDLVITLHEPSDSLIPEVPDQAVALALLGAGIIGVLAGVRGGSDLAVKK